MTFEKSQNKSGRLLGSETASAEESSAVIQTSSVPEVFGLLKSRSPLNARSPIKVLPNALHNQKQNHNPN